MGASVSSTSTVDELNRFPGLQRNRSGARRHLAKLGLLASNPSEISEAIYYGVHPGVSTRASVVYPDPLSPLYGESYLVAASRSSFDLSPSVASQNEPSPTVSTVESSTVASSLGSSKRYFRDSLGPVCNQSAEPHFQKRDLNDSGHLNPSSDEPQTRRNGDLHELLGLSKETQNEGTEEPTTSFASRSPVDVVTGWSHEDWASMSDWIESSWRLHEHCGIPLHPRVSSLLIQLRCASYSSVAPSGFDPVSRTQQQQEMEEEVQETETDDAQQQEEGGTEGGEGELEGARAGQEATWNSQPKSTAAAAPRKKRLPPKLLPPTPRTPAGLNLLKASHSSLQSPLSPCVHSPFGSHGIDIRSPSAAAFGRQHTLNRLVLLAVPPDDCSSLWDGDSLPGSYTRLDSIRECTAVSEGLVASEGTQREGGGLACEEDQVGAPAADEDDDESADGGGGAGDVTVEGYVLGREGEDDEEVDVYTLDLPSLTLRRRGSVRKVDLDNFEPATLLRLPSWGDLPDDLAAYEMAHNHGTHCATEAQRPCENCRSPSGDASSPSDPSRFFVLRSPHGRTDAQHQEVQGSSTRGDTFGHHPDSSSTTSNTRVSLPPPSEEDSPAIPPLLHASAFSRAFTSVSSRRSQGRLPQHPGIPRHSLTSEMGEEEEEDEKGGGAGTMRQLTPGIALMQSLGLESYSRKILRAVTAAHALFLQDQSPFKSSAFDHLLSVLLDLSSSSYGFIAAAIAEPEAGLHLHTCTSNFPWCQALSTTTTNNSSSSDLLVLVDDSTLFGQVILDRRIVIRNQMHAEEQPQALLERMKDGGALVTSFLGVPLCLDDRVVGMFGLANRTIPFDQRLVADLKPLADTLAQLLLSLDQQARAREEEVRYAEVFKALHEGILLVDRDGFVSSMNPYACKIFGISEERFEQEVALTASLPFTELFTQIDGKTGFLDEGCEFGKSLPATAVWRRGQRHLPVEVLFTAGECDDVAFVAVVRAEGGSRHSRAGTADSFGSFLSEEPPPNKAQENGRGDEGTPAASETQQMMPVTETGGSARSSWLSGSPIPPPQPHCKASPVAALMEESLEPAGNGSGNEPGPLGSKGSHLGLGEAREEEGGLARGPGWVPEESEDARGEACAGFVQEHAERQAARDEGLMGGPGTGNEPAAGVPAIEEAVAAPAGAAAAGAGIVPAVDEAVAVTVGTAAELVGMGMTPLATARVVATAATSAGAAAPLPKARKLPTKARKGQAPKVARQGGRGVTESAAAPLGAKQKRRMVGGSKGQRESLTVLAFDSPSLDRLVTITREKGTPKSKGSTLQLG